MVARMEFIDCFIVCYDRPYTYDCQTFEYIELYGRKFRFDKYCVPGAVSLRVT